MRRADSHSIDADHTERLVFLGTLAAAIAHEFRNVLTPVAASAQLALQCPEDSGSMAKALARAVRGIDAASNMAAVVLDLAAPCSSPAPQRADVGDAVRGALNTLQTGPEVGVEIPHGLSAGVAPHVLEHVLVNLILNAREASAPGGRIMISAGQQRGSFTWNNGSVAEAVALEVQDFGRGIPIKNLSTIFEPFVSGRPRGAGLGLSICKELIERAGGSIVATSRLGYGTLISVRLPAWVSDSAEAA